MDQDSVTPTEIETTLIICSENPEKVVEEIANIKNILDYQLISKGDRNIYDWYWDTKDESLLKKRLSLRLRKDNSKQLITLKGEAKISAWGSIERLEIELPWSNEGLSHILNEIKKRGINVNLISKLLNFDQPIQVFEDLGFKLVQERKTKRRIRNITIKNQEQVYAELAIDLVKYKIGNQPVHHFELEIESKHEDGIKVLQKSCDFLSNKFNTKLQKWIHSKLTTGKALENLLKCEPLETIVDKNSNVLPSTYDKLSALLKFDDL